MPFVPFRPEYPGKSPQHVRDEIYHGRDENHFGRDELCHVRDENHFGRDEIYHGRDENHFGRDENYFGRDENHFGRDENHFGRDGLRHVRDDFHHVRAVEHFIHAGRRHRYTNGLIINNMDVLLQISLPLVDAEFGYSDRFFCHRAPPGFQIKALHEDKNIYICRRIILQTEYRR